MKTIDEILRDYTNGEADLKKTNTALAAAKAGFRLEPGRNQLTEAELQQSAAGDCPEQACGFGLLLTGTGTPDKVRIAGGKLDFAVNEVQPDGTTNGYAEVIICGKVYEVRGDTLAERSEPKETPAVQKDVDMSRRVDLAGQKAEQKCRKGRFLVTYDADGYAVKAARI